MSDWTYRGARMPITEQLALDFKLAASAIRFFRGLVESKVEGQAKQMKELENAARRFDARIRQMNFSEEIWQQSAPWQYLPRTHVRSASPLKQGEVGTVREDGSRLIPDA